MSRILALDQGTTSSRAIVFDERGQKLSQAQLPLPQIFPQPGWVEHDAQEIWRAQVQVARDALAGASVAADDIAAIGIGNQRETVVVWDRETGVPIYNAVVWQDRRTAEVCDALHEAGHGERVRELTGLAIDPYFSATKIAWILDHVDSARIRAERGELAAGTIDSWLIWQLSGGAVHVTDETNASRTQLLDVGSGAWSAELCALFGVPEQLLPLVVRSSGVVGASVPGLLGGEIPIAGACGDQQASLVGNGCFSRGESKATFGTGIFALMHTGGTRQRSDELAVTLAARTGEQLQYALEGSIFMGGAVVQWLVEGLGIADSPADAQALAESVPDAGGVVFVPALTGLGAPYWDPYARGSVFGLTRGSTAAHVARAAMDSISLQLGDALAAMVRDSGNEISSLRVDGGVTVNDLVMQTLADVIGVPVERAAIAESTALGAAFLAGHAVEVWAGPADLPALTAVDRVFAPAEDASKRLAAPRARWAEAVRRSMRWEGDGPLRA